jgi:hypothetical protein
MTVVFKELADSPEEDYGPDGLKARRHVLVDYDDRVAFLQEIFGTDYARVTATRSGNAKYPGHSFVVVSRLRMRPYASPPDLQLDDELVEVAFDDIETNINTYAGKLMEVNIDYEVLDSSSDDNLPDPELLTYLTWRREIGGEFMTMPGMKLKFKTNAGNQVPEESIPALRVPIVNHVLEWHRVNNPPWATIQSKVGKVHVASQGSTNPVKFLGAADRRVLFVGSSASRQIYGFDDVGTIQYGWRLTYNFAEKNITWGANTYGWQDTYDPTAGTFDQLLDSNNNPIYPETDFVKVGDSLFTGQSQGV